MPDLKTQPEFIRTDRVEPSPAPVGVPADGALSAKRTPPRRAEVLAQGRALAESIMEQQRRFWMAPFNRQEQAQLLGLQREFERWEKSAAAFGIIAEMEFGDAIGLLREYRPKVTTTDLARMRRQPSPFDAHFQSIQLARHAQRPARDEADDGIWGAAGPGI